MKYWINKVAGVFFGSLERRLVGALLLVVAATGALQIVSQDRAFRLRAESGNLRVAASNAGHAEQLVKSATQFRFAARLLLTGDGAARGARAGDELTDAAMDMGDQLNALRLGGARTYDPPGGRDAFDGIDRHVATIVDVARQPHPEPSRIAALEARNAGMAAQANAILEKASADREAAFGRLGRAIDIWHLWITLAAVATVGFAVLIVIDLLGNILPALRRMHGALRRLAAGDLDFEIEPFRLRELRALSGALETFRRNAQAVQSLAFTDPSTGMANRRAFVERAGRLLVVGEEEEKRSFAVILADIDRFKHVNDDYGHAAGDRLGKLIGERMAAELGASAVIARVGGDEFAICAPAEDGASSAALGSRLLNALCAPFDLGDFTVAISLSAGLVETSGGEDVGALLNQADLALYASKNAGRNRVTRFTPDLEEERELSRALERDLAHALGEGQLRMVYQPIHALEAEENEVEALVRWRHPTLGDISPARFIPAAERSGLMVQLGYWIVQRALADLCRWPHLSMSINLSPLQLQQDGFVGFLMDCCRAGAIAPRRVTLEVTESLSIERNTRALMTLNLLRSAGFRIALDDFGTGYSSLCMMKNFKFDRLKLDRSLISDLGSDATSQAVFDAAVTMALSIGAEVVAEGISEARLVVPVREAGCTHVQGFHYSRPIEAEAVDAYYGVEKARHVA